MAPFVINARFSDRILAPAEAFPLGCADMLPVRTTDKVDCVAHFLSTWNNGDGRYNDELDGLCHRQWGCSFALVRSMWEGRIDRLSNIWHFIELKIVKQ